MTEIILASSSPGRRELLEKTKIKFRVEPSNFDEKSFRSDNPEKLVRYLASGKARGVAKQNIDSIVIGADTVVYHDCKIIEKPKDPPSNLAVIGVYIFSPKIFTALENVKPDQSGEKQLTDAIQYLITKGAKVLAVELAKDEKRVDIGTVETYRETLNSMIL